MTADTTMAQHHDSSEPSCSSEPAQSLTNAVYAIARDAGRDLNYDDLMAAMGMCWSPLAVPEEADIGRWPMYARDAFLCEAGQLFGLTIRDMHPPEAARGLSSAAEFAQHFDASYRPLIRRALEHEQPVLAWQGWCGERRMDWCVIQDVCNGGIGFTATRHTTASESCESVALTQPPVQLYVVENIVPSLPEGDRLVELVVRHAATTMCNGLAGRFDVVTGPGAYDVWIERLDEQSKSGRDVDRLRAAHRRLASASLDACACGIRCLQRNRPDARGTLADKAAGVLDGMNEVVRELRIALSSELGSGNHCEIRAALTRARDATRRMSLRLPS